MRDRSYGLKTLQDILEIPNSIDVIKRGIDEIVGVADLIIDRGCRRLYFTGCGSSYYSAMLVSFPLQVSETGLEVIVVPSSEIIMYYSGRLSRDCCMIAISRSGETAETLEAIKTGRERGAFSLIITISERSKGMEYSDRYLYINVGAERGIVMTKSFYSMTLAGLLLTSSIVNRILGGGYNIASQLDILKGHAINTINERNRITDLVENYIKRKIDRFVFLGSGPSYPIALEASLKLKESSYIATEAFHALEFRHGPIATVSESILIVIINQEGRSYSHVYKLYRELKKMNANILRLSSKDLDEDVIRLSTTGCEELDSLSAILPLQLIAYAYTSALGLDIDNPRNLVRVVTKY